MRRVGSRNARRLLDLVASESPRVALGVALQVLTVGSGIALMATSAWLVSTAALHPSIAALSVAIVGVRFFGLSRGILRYLERLVSHDLTLRLLSRLRARVFRALVPLAPARLLAHRGGDLLGRVVEDVATLENLYVRVLGPSLAAAVLVLGVGASLVPAGSGLAVVAVAGLLVGGVAAPALAAWSGEEPGRLVVAGRGELAAGAVDGVQGCGELLAFGREADHAARMDERGRGLMAEQARLTRASALGASLATLAADLTVVGALVLAIPAVRAGRLDGVSLAVVALLTLAAFESVAALPAAWQGLGATRTAARRLFEILDTTPAVTEPVAAAAVADIPKSPTPSSDARQTGSADPRLPPGADGRHVRPSSPSRDHEPILEVRLSSFTYPGEARPALSGLDLRLERDRRMAVVGASGSGKSTLAHLLLRFWDVPPGAIRLEGRDVTTLAGDATRGRIAFAAQRTHLFTGTLRENLTLARPAATDAELHAALSAARLEELVRGMPDGLETWVGEQGLRLSGGERQRLALARAFLREAPLLLLDEPTAHVDPVTERELLAEIVRAGAGRATLLITHRLVGLEAFDEVVVLDRGRVVERGPSADLASRDGPIARMLGRQRAAGALGDATFTGSEPAPRSREAEA